METKSPLGTVLSLLGITGLTFAIIGVLTSYITRSLFAGLTLLGCILFFAGVTLLCDQLNRNINN
jgi:apolipoprotein N-acyltransferase